MVGVKHYLGSRIVPCLIKQIFDLLVVQFQELGGHFELWWWLAPRFCILCDLGDAREQFVYGTRNYACLIARLKFHIKTSAHRVCLTTTGLKQ